MQELVVHVRTGAHGSHVDPRSMHHQVVPAVVPDVEHFLLAQVAHRRYGALVPHLIGPPLPLASHPETERHGVVREGNGEPHTRVPAATAEKPQRLGGGNFVQVREYNHRIVRQVWPPRHECRKDALPLRPLRRVHLATGATLLGAETAHFHDLRKVSPAVVQHDVLHLPQENAEAALGVVEMQWLAVAPEAIARLRNDVHILLWRQIVAHSQGGVCLQEPQLQELQLRAAAHASGDVHKHSGPLQHLAVEDPRPSSVLAVHDT
mmetsp:Transcript_74156/g.239814  ORF Transcript_74156/g.239814 Transcript_74156/m.239814 type:complete len:264 (+) Transcript_74156:558-1349(+)